MADDGSIRVGDEERRAVDARLQRAHGEGRLSLEEYEERSARAWAARTRGDLTELTVDLPADGAVARAGHTGEVAAPTPAREVVTEFARRAGSALGTVVVLGAVLWGGSHLLGGDDGTVVFGSRTIGVAENADRVDVGVLFGSVQVVVPDDVRVDASGWKVFGSTDCPTACTGTGTREIAVEVSGAFGSTEILTRTEAAAEPRDADDDD